MTFCETQAFDDDNPDGDHGSVRWMAPELFCLGAKKTRASDVYSFAMTILEVNS